MSRSNFYRKHQKPVLYSDCHAHIQLRMTQALVKFCCEHQRSQDTYIRAIEACAQALERKDIREAVEQYLLVPLGGNGCFNDWAPPVVYEYETEDYVQAVFEALTSSWAFHMSKSIPCNSRGR